MTADVETLAATRIRTSAKYRSLAEETIRDVLRSEMGRHGEAGRAESSARAVLHRVAAFYLGEPDYRRVRADLEGCPDPGCRARVCRGVLALHQSTRERLPVLEEMYGALFRRTGIPAVLSDLAAACNPFAYPWMGLPPSTRYYAYDINADMVSLVGRYFALEGIPGAAIHRDILCRPAEQRADVALLLKMYHCLERRRPGAGWEVLENADAAIVAVSFPTRNLRGKSADIASNYRPTIADRSARRGWHSEEFSVEGERVLLVRKGT